MEPKRSDLGLLLIPRILLAVAFVVAACHLIDVFTVTNWQNENYFRDFFDMGAEANLPTWFASVLWATTCVAAALCFTTTKGMPLLKRVPWLMISAAFGIASLDEVAELHENVGHIIHQAQLSTGNPHYLHDGSPGSPWILVYLPFLIAAALFFVWFLWSNLPRKYFWMICGGFACFAVAISCDFFQGLWGPNKQAIVDALHMNRNDVVYGSIFLEENLENIGTLLFAWAFLGKYQQARRAREAESQDESASEKLS
jgi:hypothetical protein